jgi:hypothetical protein
MREIRQSGSVRGVRRKPYPYRDLPKTDAVGSAGFTTLDTENTSVIVGADSPFWPTNRQQSQL